MVGERRSRNLQPALDFSDHRPYSSGDDLRHMDWYAYARHKDLFVKLGEATQRIDVHILLDASRSMGWEPDEMFERDNPAARPQPANKWDMARRLTGALGYLGLTGGERVKITPFADTLGGSFGPSQGKRQVMANLKFLSDLGPALMSDGRGGLSTCLTDYARMHPRGGLLLIVSDMLDTINPADLSIEADTLADGLRHLSPPRWQVLVMHLLSTHEVRPGLTGDYDLQDIETTESLPFHLDEATLAQYRLRVRRWCAALQSACARRGAIYSRILAEWPLEQKMVPYLRQRGVLQ